ncbi:MAG: hypothetical protein KatS3mg008_1262 [Acidimicrobiales bacterium]|nr:MAG: hypothetical protein KatS3mg008_1262 [Acidimicrobiales bacterium]
MDRREYVRRWQQVEEDLLRARRALPPEAPREPLVRFHDHLDEGNLSDALEVLEAIGHTCDVGVEFWQAMVDAACHLGRADKMERFLASNPGTFIREPSE